MNLKEGVGRVQVAVHGKHAICEIWGADPALLDNLDYMRSAMRDAAHLARANIRSEAWEKFEPQGLTGVLVLSESHLTVHTYPEYGYAAVDCFTCGRDCDPLVACVHLVDRLGESCYGVVVYLPRPADGRSLWVGRLSKDQGKVVFHACPV